MKEAAALLILVASLWSLIPASHSLRMIVSGLEDLGGINTMADPPDEGNVIFQPPPR